VCIVFAQEFEDSEDCQDNFNINASPETIKHLPDLQRATVLIKFADGRGCTGTLLNQKVSGPYLKQLMFTAYHCLKDVDLRNENVTLHFNYQSPDEHNSSVPDDNKGWVDSNGDGIRQASEELGTRYPLPTKLRYIARAQGAEGDMALMEIVEPIPPHYNVYYAGWSSSIFRFPGSIYNVIQHPGGDIKKKAVAPSVVTITNTACHVVMEIVDRVLNFFFGWIFKREIRLRSICSYVESPFYLAPYYSEGSSEGGSSGSGLIHYERVIGALSGSLATCSKPNTITFGRFDNFYNRSYGMRLFLNPHGSSFSSVIGGRNKCHTSLTGSNGLSGYYYPAKDYQRENLITIKASGKIESDPVLPLIIDKDAEFNFFADEIHFKPSDKSGSVHIQKASNVRIVPNAGCNINARKGKIDYKEKFRREVMNSFAPVFNKEFDYDKYLTVEEAEEVKNTIAELQVTPNPNNGRFTIRLSDTEQDVQKILEVFNIQGSKVYGTTFTGNSLNVNLAASPRGVYLVRVVVGNKLLTKKVIIQ
jgi:hypothetical protein